MITTATNSAVAALAMSPIDWGLSASAILLVIFAARALVTGEGKAQMGCGFMFVAAAVGTFAIGRQVDGFGLVDGARITVGILLLVPVFRVLFSHKEQRHGGGDLPAAASVIAGPVVARIFPEHVETGASREVPPIDEGGASNRSSRGSEPNWMRSRPDGGGTGCPRCPRYRDPDELARSEEALQRLRTYKDLLDDRRGLGAEIEALEKQLADLRAYETALAEGAEGRGALAGPGSLRGRPGPPRVHAARVPTPRATRTAPSCSSSSSRRSRTTDRLSHRSAGPPPRERGSGGSSFRADPRR